MTGASRAVAALAVAAAAACASGPDPAAVDAGLHDLEALAARSAPDGDPSTVDLLLAPDLDFLRRLGTDAVPSLERAVAAVDRILGPEVGLRFRVGGAVLFPSTPDCDDARRLLWEARLRVGRGKCDVAAAFTGQRCGDRAGSAEPDLRLLLCADASDPERNLLHEAAHLFGAKDYARGHPGYGIPSLMSYDSDAPRTLALDESNLARIRSRRGTLPAPRSDLVREALAARRERLPEAARDALLESFLCAESRSGHAEGIAPAVAFLRTCPEHPVGLWVLGECLRIWRDRDTATARFGSALRGLAGKRPPDGLDRHAALEIARLVVDGIDGLDALRPEAEATLTRISEAFPRDPELLDLRASLRARAGDRVAAEALYREAAAADPSAVYPWRHLAALGRTAGDAALWLEAWRRALSVDSLDPVLAIRWVGEWIEEYHDLILTEESRRDAEAALDAAERAFPGWPRPGELRRALRDRTP